MIAKAPLFWSDPDLPFVESRRADDSCACYRLHSHPTVSVGWVEAGQSLFSCHGRTYPLTAGCLVLIPADQVHACNPPAGGRWSYRMLYFDSGWWQRQTGALPAAAAVWRDPVRLRQWRVAEGCLHGAAGADLKAARLRAAVRALGPFPGAAGVEAEATVAAAPAREIAERCAERLAIADLAAEAGLSPGAFIRRFRGRMGLTPHAWQIDQRINRARALLRQGLPLAEVALSLGFADQSHFQRAFKDRVAATPGQYRIRRNFLQDR